MIHPIFEKLLAPFAPPRGNCPSCSGTGYAPNEPGVVAYIGSYCLSCRGSGQERKIITTYWAKPIPIRSFDWCAYYDGDEPNDNGQMLHGYGATEAEAIAELRQNAEDRT